MYNGYQIQVDDDADKRHPADFSGPERDETTADTDHPLMIWAMFPKRRSP